VGIWKPGDLVRLKSGGPIMTVSAITSRDKVDCHWFVGETLKATEFHSNALTSPDMSSLSDGQIMAELSDDELRKLSKGHKQ
jgi:uncharacterized protein YodC (DUF2158 family)